MNHPVREILAVIPARYGSSRFEGKPLADINGHTMLEWVFSRISASKKITRVVAAIDDERVEAVCISRNIPYLMTSKHHATSTERLHEVSRKIKADLYICVNGDEPLIDHDRIEQIIPDGMVSETPYVANLTCRIVSPAEVVDPSNIKVVWNQSNDAIFFSRSPIPYPKGSLEFDYYKHIGVLIYNSAALEHFSITPKGPLEKIEDVNELRFIESGIPIRMIVVEPRETLSVDTPTDLQKVREIVRMKNLRLLDR